MRATGGRIRIRTIDIPTLSGPTSGVTMMDELKEFVVQGERWTIGAAEVFHYFFVKLLKCNYFLPGLQYFWWFVYYYGFILCVAGLIQISGYIIALASIGYPEIGINQCKPFQDWFNLSDDFNYAWIMGVFQLLFWVIVALPAFCMDALVSQILALDEHVNPIRNFLHFVFSQVALWIYNLIEFYAIVKVAIYGKKVCGHKASEKHALAGKKEGD
jgi:cellulose synthase/poly-beta-1,6-N-acetylglucosamine synthase-like glycosyltransferase